MTTMAYDPKPTVVWEMTRVCDLDCRGCPNVEHGSANPEELWTYEAYKTIDEIASVHPGRFVISGGDPLQRRDLSEILDYARRRGLDPIVALSPTAIADEDAIRRLGRKGVRRVIVSLDDDLAEDHDELRGMDGSFRATLHLLGSASTAGMEVEVSTLVMRRNVDHLPSLHRRLVELGVSAWNLYLFVPLRGANDAEMLTGAEVEQLFADVRAMRATMPIRMIEAQAERRYEIQVAAEQPAGHVAVASETAEEVLYITDCGDVWPSELLPIVAGNVRNNSLASIHQHGEIFTSLRNRSNLKGKCGLCDYRFVCGGSRARAYATTGDPFESDPCCAYQPEEFHIAPSLTIHAPVASC